ncbi:MAG: cytochrome c [Henriciella sp.]|uniref:c-type cytochrome n=1 Tax=Henriciella sp. TaxID=1968823 RepID=UPI003C777633
MNSRIGLLLGLAFIAIAACGQTESPASTPVSDTGETDADLIADGRDIVEDQCTTCHAIGASDDSPRADAPPLRTVLADFDPEALADDFREGIHVGHPDMPDFEFGPIGTDAVLAYLVSIQAPQPVD